LTRRISALIWPWPRGAPPDRAVGDDDVQSPDTGRPLSARRTM